MTWKSNLKKQVVCYLNIYIFFTLANPSISTFLQVLKNCNLTIEAGKTYLGFQRYLAAFLYLLLDEYLTIFCVFFCLFLCCIQSNLVQSMLQVSMHFKGDPAVSQALNKVANSLQETIKYHSILIDQTSRSVSRSLNNFLKKWVPYSFSIYPLEKWMKIHYIQHVSFLQGFETSQGQ
jgi:hypothetical protein